MFVYTLVNEVEVVVFRFNSFDIISCIKMAHLLFVSGIQAHRSSDNLMCALQHIKSMSSRMDDSGIVQDYTYKDLHDILVESGFYRLEDFERVLEEHLNTNGL